MSQDAREDNTSGMVCDFDCTSVEWPRLFLCSQTYHTEQYTTYSITVYHV